MEPSYKRFGARMAMAFVWLESIVTPGVRRATSPISLTPFNSIVSLVSTLRLMGTLLRDSSRRVAVTVTSAITPVSAGDSGVAAASAALAVAEIAQSVSAAASCSAPPTLRDDARALLADRMTSPRFGVHSTPWFALLPLCRGSSRNDTGVTAAEQCHWGLPDVSVSFARQQATDTAAGMRGAIRKSIIDKLTSR